MPCLKEVRLSCLRRIWGLRRGGCLEPLLRLTLPAIGGLRCLLYENGTGSTAPLPLQCAGTVFSNLAQNQIQLQRTNEFLNSAFGVSAEHAWQSPGQVPDWPIARHWPRGRNATQSGRPPLGSEPGGSKSIYAITQVARRCLCAGLLVPESEPLMRVKQPRLISTHAGDGLVQLFTRVAFYPFFIFLLPCSHRMRLATSIYVHRHSTPLRRAFFSRTDRDFQIKSSKLSCHKPSREAPHID